MVSLLGNLGWVECRCVADGAAIGVNEKKYIEYMHAQRRQT